MLVVRKMANTNCSLIVGNTPSPLYSPNELKEVLESGSEEEKHEALKQTIGHIVNGDQIPSLLMTVIRFVMPTKDSHLKKLAMTYLEVVPKTGSNGKLLRFFFFFFSFLFRSLFFFFFEAPSRICLLSFKKKATKKNFLQIDWFFLFLAK